MTSKSFSGTSLEKALQEGALTQSQAVLTGMVKSSEQSGYINFSQSNCETWVDLPTSMIEQADYVAQSPCRDHSHPVMRITLKEPSDAEGKILSALLAQAAPPSPTQLPPGDALRSSPLPSGSFSGPVSRQALNPANPFIFCRLVCVEYSELFPNICNRWALDCGWGPLGPIIVLPQRLTV